MSSGARRHARARSRGPGTVALGVALFGLLLLGGLIGAAADSDNKSDSSSGDEGSAHNINNSTAGTCTPVAQAASQQGIVAVTACYAACKGAASESARAGGRVGKYI